jgi:hypothetical protein
MPDLSAVLPTTELEEAFLRVVDVEGKLTAALEDLGPVAGRDVSCWTPAADSESGSSPRSGRESRPWRFPPPCDEPAALALLAELPAGDADVVVVPWSELATPGSCFLDRRSGCCGRAAACCWSTTTAATTSGPVARPPRSPGRVEPCAAGRSWPRAIASGHPLLVDVRVDGAGPRPARRRRSARLAWSWPIG